jgi:hypothetical protein
MPVKKKKRGTAVRKRKRSKAKRKVHGAVKGKRTKRKPVKRKPAKRKVSATRKKRSKPKRKRSKRAKGTLIIQQSSVRTRRTVGKKKRARRRKPVTRKRTRRVSGKKGISTGLLVGLAVGLGGLYLLSQSSKTTTPYPSTQYPPLQQNSNAIRNSQTSEVVSYAIAAGYAVDAISKLIDLFNNSSDAEVQQVYDHVDSGGDIGIYV